MSASILIVDDEKDMRTGLEHYFRLKKFETYTAESGEKALENLAAHQVDLVITDMAMPGMDGLELLHRIKAAIPGLPVIIITGVGTVDSAVAAMNGGAYHFISKPFRPDKLEALALKAIDFGRVHRSLNRQGKSADADEDLIVGNHPVMQEIMHSLEKVAVSSAPILIQGETGTGKSMLAKRVHRMSPRAKAPFYTIDCSSLTEPLLESELFGHVRGAFTGALRSKRGMLEEAKGGTIFLDEIGELTPATQAKLLTAMQEKIIKPVGGNKLIPIDARFIVATNRDLKSEVREGRFREDLFYRITVIPINLPSLRERIKDIPLFLDHFVKKFNKLYGKDVSRIHPVVFHQFMNDLWPGNIRELENVIERAVLLSEGSTITSGNLKTQGEPLSPPAIEGPSLLLSDVMDETERIAICKALELTKGNRTKAAQVLGISRRALYLKLDRHKIN